MRSCWRRTRQLNVSACCLQASGPMIQRPTGSPRRPWECSWLRHCRAVLGCTPAPRVTVLTSLRTALLFACSSTAAGDHRSPPCVSHGLCREHVIPAVTKMMLLAAGKLCEALAGPSVRPIPRHIWGVLLGPHRMPGGCDCTAGSPNWQALLDLMLLARRWQDVRLSIWNDQQSVDTVWRALRAHSTQQ